MKYLTIDARLWKKSGIGTYLQNIVSGLIQTYPVIYYYLLTDQNDPINPAELPDANLVKTIPIKSKIFSISEQFEILQKTPSETDLFWAPHINVPILINKPLLTTIHDAYHLSEYATLDLSKRLALRIYFWKIKSAAIKIITVSDFSASQINRYLGIPQGRLETIYNGVSDFWKPNGTTDSVMKRPYLLYVGNIKPHKNLQVLLKAFSNLTKTIPHNLVLVGEYKGFITKDNQSISLAKKLNDRVSIKGHVSNPELLSLYRSADALIFPSLYEGFGLPPLEAMACKCPVISSSNAPMPEIYKDAALYFNPEDEVDLEEKILNLIQNQQTREGLILRGLSVASIYSWDTAVKKTKKTIQELI